MPWFRVDDGFPEHPKIEELEARPVVYMAAMTVWLVMGTDCARRLTDGTVTQRRLQKAVGFLGKHAAVGAAALVDIGLWTVVENRWQYHDWHKYQPTRKSVEASRESKRLRQKRWRDGKNDDNVDASRIMSHNPSVNAASDAIPRVGLGRAGISEDRGSGGEESAPGTANDWLRYFGTIWAERRGKLHYGHSGDSKACGSLAAVLDDWPVDQCADAWDQRERIVAAFMAETEDRVVKAGHIFAFFVPRFTALYAKPAKKPTFNKPPEYQPPAEWPAPGDEP